MGKRKFITRAKRLNSQQSTDNVSSPDSDKVEAKPKRIKTEQLPLNSKNISNENSKYDLENQPLWEIDDDQNSKTKDLFLDSNDDSLESANISDSDDIVENLSYQSYNNQRESTRIQTSFQSVQNQISKQVQRSNVIVVDSQEIDNAANNSCLSFLKAFQFFSDDEDDNKIYEKISNITSNANEELKKIENTATLDTFQIEDFSSESSKNIRILSDHSRNTEVLFIDYPQSVLLHGHLKVTLLSGKVSVYAYELKPESSVTVFSKKETGFIPLEAKIYQKSKSRRKWLINTLSYYIKNYSSGDLKKFLRQNCGISTSVVILEHVQLPYNLQFLELYAPEAVCFKNLYKKKYHYVFPKDNEKNSIDFSGDYNVLFTRLEKHLYKINKKKLSEDNVSDFSSSSEGSFEDMISMKLDSIKIKGSRVVVYGPKKSGKSTLLRYLINSFLNKYKEVFYLDTDPGQTEFTPPGVVSLTKVTEPLFGPPFTHQWNPVKMIFTGTITPETSPQMHVRSVKYLLDYFNANFSENILVVNTMGWITGIGDIILQLIKKDINPTVEIELTTEFTQVGANMEGEILKFQIGFDRNPSKSTKKGDCRPADLRDWSLLAYLGRCQQFFKLPTYLNSMRPLCVKWDEIAVYNFNKRLPYNRFYEALNCSIVALCNVDECFMLMSTHPDYPNTLDDEPNNDCLGFGLVRAIDETNHLLYVITPLEFQQWEKVNAILSGNILVPRSVILNQPIYDTELPYTDESDKGRTLCRKAIKRRTRIDTFNLKKT